MIPTDLDSGGEIGNTAATDLNKELLQLVEVTLIKAVRLWLISPALGLVCHAEHLIGHLGAINNLNTITKKVTSM